MFTKVDAETFAEAIKNAKNALSVGDNWRVDAHEVDEYVGADCYINDNATVAIKNGDIISVCKGASKVKGFEILKFAVSKGGKKLDAFGEGLFNFYTKNGFEPVSWCMFDVNYAPAGWVASFGFEPVIFYMYTGKANTITYDDFIATVAPSKDYEEAMNARNAKMN